MDDEVGVVTRSFNQMLESIRENIDQLKESMERQAQMKERELLMEAHLKEAQLKYPSGADQSAFSVQQPECRCTACDDGRCGQDRSIFLKKWRIFSGYNVRKMEEDAMLWEEIGGGR